MLACSMPPVRSITDFPPDILRAIVQSCCGNSIYSLAAIRAVSKNFRASVDVISSSLTIADMSGRYLSRELHRWSSDDMVKGILERCEKLIGLLLSGRLFLSMPQLGLIFTYLPNTLCILQLHHCDLCHVVMPDLGRCLPHLQGLSLCSSRFYGAVSPWDGFPQLKLLRVDWTEETEHSAIEPFRSQLWYLSCHGCSAIDDRVCEGLDSCIALDLAYSPISDAGLQILMDKGAPNLKLLLLNTKDGNLWDDGRWTTAMAERVQQRGIRVVQSAGYGTNRAAVRECLREALRDRPQVLEYAAEYVL